MTKYLFNGCNTRYLTAAGLHLYKMMPVIEVANPGWFKHKTYTLKYAVVELRYEPCGLLQAYRHQYKVLRAFDNKQDALVDLKFYANWR